LHRNSGVHRNSGYCKVVLITTLVALRFNQPAHFYLLPQDPTKLRYGCGVATAAQADRVSSDLAALEPKVTAAAVVCTLVQADMALIMPAAMED
jgi:hypothetical protein